MKWTTGFAILFVGLLVAGVTAPGAASGAFGTDSRQVGDLEADLVTISATVAPDGTAELQIRYAIRLADETETQAFEDLEADIQENTSVYLGRFSDRMNATVDSAETATGRAMTIDNFSVRTNTSKGFDRTYGLVTYSATWANFAAVSEDQIQVGDALAGLFIDEETEFRVQWDSAYELDTVEPEPNEITAGSVTWSGPLEFGENEPSVTLVPATEDTTTESTTSQPADEGGVPWLLIIVALGLLALFGGGWFWRTGDGSLGVGGPPSGTPAGQEPPETAEEPAPPPELLSNEERVEQYLESVGGRAKQQEIVDALEWTEAKTSQVLSDMQENGTIEKFRIGRENVVKIPDSEDSL